MRQADAAIQANRYLKQILDALKRIERGQQRALLSNRNTRAILASSAPATAVEQPRSDREIAEAMVELDRSVRDLQRTEQECAKTLEKWRAQLPDWDVLLRERQSQSGANPQPISAKESGAIEQPPNRSRFVELWLGPRSFLSRFRLRSRRSPSDK